MYTYKIKNAYKYSDIPANIITLAVSYQLIDEDGNVVEESNHGFPLDTTTEQLESYFNELCNSRWENNLVHLENAELDAKLAVADKTIEEILSHK
ncbi:MAG: hypothetical protein KGN01_07165 [Patescibacteria group bacterium]|nr:hypothetical protein [Patescibacteria group bacterium]